MLETTKTPKAIVEALDQYVIGQDQAKRVVAVAVYAHFRKVLRAAQTGAPVVKSNVLLIGPSGTGKTLLCETLSKILGVPFATAEATSLAQTQYVNDEIEAILQRLVDKAGGDVAKAGHGIVFIDEIDKLKSTGNPARLSGESVQHALLKIMEGAQVKLGSGSYVDTTGILFVCGGAFVGLDEIIKSQTHGYAFIATTKSDSQKILDRLNSRVKPTDLFTYGLIPEFTGRLPIVARFDELSRETLIRIMTEPRDAIYTQFRDIFAGDRRGARRRAESVRPDRRARDRVQDRGAKPARPVRGADLAGALSDSRRARHRARAVRIDLLGTGDRATNQRCVISRTPRSAPAGISTTSEHRRLSRQLMGLAEPAREALYRASRARSSLGLLAEQALRLCEQQETLPNVGTFRRVAGDTFRNRDRLGRPLLRACGVARSQLHACRDPQRSRKLRRIPRRGGADRGQLVLRSLARLAVMHVGPTAVPPLPLSS